jgi:hypothetical protein
MRDLFVSAALAAIAVGLCASDASAQPRRHRVVVATDTGISDSIPLTVNRRSWLDPGPVSSVGKGPSYVAASTQFSRDQEQIINPDKFGNDVLQGQPYVPGRSVPVVEFSTTPAGHVNVDNTLGYQNYYFSPTPPDVPREAAAVPVFPTE